jgi:hypothetical protein
MNKIKSTSAWIISLALPLTSVPLPVLSAVTAQTQVFQSAVPGGIIGLPVSVAAPSLGNGSLLTSASSLNLNGTLALPPEPVVTVGGAAASAYPVAAPGATAGILPRQRASQPGVVLDQEPAAPDPRTVRGVFIESYDLPGAGASFAGNAAARLPADPSDEADVERALRARVDADPAKYGVSSSQLATVHVRRVAGQGHQADTIYAFFQQRQNGVAVHGAGLGFTIKALRDGLQVVSETARLYPNAAPEAVPRFSEEELRAKALARLGPQARLRGVEAGFLERKIVYVNGAWHAASIYLIEDGPAALLIAVDVATGEAFAWEPQSGASASNGPALSGALSGRSVEPGPILPGAKIKEIPLGYLEVKIGGKTYLTDWDGRFQAGPELAPAPEGLRLSAALSGPHARVADASGRTLSVDVLVKPGKKDLKVVFNPDSKLSDEGSLAQVSAFYNVNADYEFLRSRRLTTELMDRRALLVRTNLNADCNAFYMPGRPSLNFFKSSENCVNSSYATVSRHEYGHYWDDMTGGIVNGGLSEGWGDTLSMYSLNNPIIGEHFFKRPRPGPEGGPGDYIRDGDNTYQYAGEGGEAHDIGQAWGGFNWKVRKALMAKLGAAAGAALAEALVLPTMFAKAANVPAAMAQVLLADMDSHGRMPHQAEIRAAAAAHGVRLPRSPEWVASCARRVLGWALGLMS